MYQNIKNTASKSQLAKLLATENINVIHKPGIKTAWFDVKARILALPVWVDMSVDLYDMLTVHEVGHALDTDADAWMEAIETLGKKYGKSKKGVIKDFLNVVEDARIDKRQKRRYPGSRRNYVKGYKELLDKDFFGTLSNDVNKMLFIDRINIHFKGGHLHGVRFNKEEKKFLARIEMIETFAEVVEIVDELLVFCAGELKQKQKQNEEAAKSLEEAIDGLMQMDLDEEADELLYNDEEDEDDDISLDFPGIDGEFGDDDETDADADEGDADSDEDSDSENNDSDEEDVDSDDDLEYNTDDGADDNVYLDKSAAGYGKMSETELTKKYESLQAEYDALYETLNGKEANA